jgi:hypothetical protein
MVCPEKEILRTQNLFLFSKMIFFVVGIFIKTGQGTWYIGAQETTTSRGLILLLLYLHV